MWPCAHVSRDWVLSGAERLAGTPVQTWDSGGLGWHLEVWGASPSVLALGPGPKHATGLPSSLRVGWVSGRGWGAFTFSGLSRPQPASRCCSRTNQLLQALGAGVAGGSPISPRLWMWEKGELRGPSWGSPRGNLAYQGCSSSCGHWPGPCLV